MKTYVFTRGQTNNNDDDNNNNNNNNNNKLKLPENKTSNLHSGEISLLAN